MSKPFTEIKEAIESVGKQYEEKRPSVNWFDALDDDGSAGNVRRSFTDVSPAASSENRPGKKGEPKKK